MKTCCITGLPFYGSPQVIAIPVIIRAKKIMQTSANDNVHPLPIAFSGTYNFDEFYPYKDERFDYAMKAISSLVHKKTTWEDFSMFEVNNEFIEYDNEQYSFGLFLCYKSAFDNIINNLNVSTIFNNLQSVGFSDYTQGLKDYIFNNSIFKLANKLTTPVSFLEKLPVLISSYYALPYDFDKHDLSCYSEIRFLNHFLNATGKQWTVSVKSPEEKQESAIGILIDSFNVVAKSI